VPPLFDERPIAVIWDFDDTLIWGSMQTPIFEKFGVKEAEFWDEANKLADFYKSRGLDLVSDDTLYLNHILRYVRDGHFKGLNNEMLKELGGRLELHEGLPHFLDRAKQVVADSAYADLGIVVEHYIVSTGLRKMIQGSAINDYVEFIWACEFVEETAPRGYLDNPPDPPANPEIQDIGYTINNTTKTRAIFEINKGTNVRPEITVNRFIRPEDRRVPFENMIYIADGPSDVPVYSILQQYGGKTYCVFKPGDQAHFERAQLLRKQGRVDETGEANYEDGSPVTMWICSEIAHTAQRMLERREAERDALFAERVGEAPGHIVPESPGAPNGSEETGNA
jgi:haloacid dehalogenase-like hydrolase